MIPFDSHTHSRFSFDGNPAATPDEMCRAALEKKITHLAITDHFEANNDPEGLDMPYDAAAAYESVLAAKETYAGSLVLSYGIEAGQVHQYPALSERFLSSHPFETVIGSVHNLRGKPDFYFWDMRNMSEDEFFGYWIVYLREILELLSFGGIDILAHLTYPIRYLIKAGRNYDLSKDHRILEQIFEWVLDHDILLEVNTSGYRQAMESTLPDRRILSLYRQMGGNRISIGSDAHKPSDIGADYDRAEKFLLSLGFDRVSFVQNKQISEHLLGAVSTKES
ncbi:MAG: histidinol-phosphatase HisJ family protein [Eubacteriales bacterium]